MVNHPETSNRRKLLPPLEPKGEGGAQDSRPPPCCLPVIPSSAGSSLGLMGRLVSLEGNAAIEISLPGAQSKGGMADLVGQMGSVQHSHVCRCHQALGLSTCQGNVAGPYGENIFSSLKKNKTSSRI